MRPVSRASRPAGGRRRRRTGPHVVAVAVALLAVPCAGAQDVIERTMAVVAGDLIMMSDVAAALEFGLVPVTSGPETTRLVLSQLIDRSLMLAEVERYAPPEPSAAQVEREVERTRGRFASPDAYRAGLERYGLSEAHLRETLRANLRLRSYLEQRFTAFAPSDEELAAYYATHAGRFARGGQRVDLADVREDVAQALIMDRRQAMVDGWIADLRRRATVADLSDAPR